jgi:N-methylhydantoinase A/oxoprolinase/acetone carboxylase beta subunit
MPCGRIAIVFVLYFLRQNGFDASLRQGVTASKDERRTVVEMMTSDGGLVDVNNFSGLKSILSGPAGGVVGFALTSWDEKKKTPVIGLDMVRIVFFSSFFLTVD